MLNLRVGRQWTPGTRSLEAWVGVDNVTDAEYIANVRVNASGGRYLEPAPGRAFLAGVELGF
jgi:iron complex outermembrane receptor protein